MSKPNRQMINLLIGLFLLLVIAWIDYATGSELSASIFYLIPIIFIARSCGSFWGYVTVIASAVLWFLSDVFSGHDYMHPMIPYWNALVRLGIFLIVCIIFTRLQMQLKHQEENNLKLSAANREILKLSQMKSEFVATVSHDLRTPLAAIKESIEILCQEGAGSVNHEQRTYLEMCRRNIERLVRLINDVLDFSKLESGKMSLRMKKQNINPAISEIVSTHEPVTARKGVMLRCRLDKDLPETDFDPDAISRVISNLISNAIKNTNEGEVIVSTKVAGQRLEVSVKDTGIGIEESNLEKLFLPFEQAAAKGGIKPAGSGLGLAISKRIIEMHNGEIFLKSKIGEGTTASFTLPIVKDVFNL